MATTGVAGRVRVRLMIIALTAIALSSVNAAAQSIGATTGSLNGRVTDASGGVLPGVTVSATSASLQGARTTVTNEEGAYRLPGVPPGMYVLQYELGGFGTVIRDGINVSVGFTASINVESPSAAPRPSSIPVRRGRRRSSRRSSSSRCQTRATSGRSWRRRRRFK
jgi:hypothetical protein